MNKIFKIAVISIIASGFVSIPHLSSAQNYKGHYDEKAIKKQKIEDKTAAPVPKVFSSKVSSTQQAEKLDIIYNDLLTSLWLYASTDFTYQKALLSSMEPERFRLTRYPKEFSGDLKNAMKNLNKNYKDMMGNIEAAQNKYLEIRETIRIADQEELEKIWNEEISEFKKDAITYFKMQNKFLNFYKNLVNFILKQGGKYYYDSEEQKVKFYEFGEYEFFSNVIDKLHKITYMQKKLLKKHTPANTDIILD